MKWLVAALVLTGCNTPTVWPQAGAMNPSCVLFCSSRASAVGPTTVTSDTLQSYSEGDHVTTETNTNSSSSNR